MATWDEMTDERDDDGNLTTLAVALDALRDHGCDCGVDEPGTCLACLCEVALCWLWERLGEVEAEIMRLRSALDMIAHTSNLGKFARRVLDGGEPREGLTDLVTKSG